MQLNGQFTGQAKRDRDRNILLFGNLAQTNVTFTVEIQQTTSPPTITTEDASPIDTTATTITTTTAVSGLFTEIFTVLFSVPVIY